MRRFPLAEVFATAPGVAAVVAEGETLPPADCHVSMMSVPAGDPCRDKFPKINAGAKAMRSAMAETDKVFVSKYSQFYDLSLTASQNAALALRNLIKE